MKKKKREIDKGRIFENSCVMLFGAFFILILLFILFPGSMSSLFDKDSALSHTEDEYVKSVALLCGLRKDYFDKFGCVMDFFSRVYEFNSTLFGHKSPTEMLLSGGDCLDTSIFFCSVFNLLEGIECNVIDLGDINHSAVIVMFENKYCLVDQTIYQCITVGGYDKIDEQDIKI